jgi:RNA polymerase sigma-70 factor (ECF subfamily)
MTNNKGVSMAQDEMKIIKSCQAGNLDDFALLYDAYIEKIYNFIYYKTHHRQTAEDLTGQTFMKALKNIGNFDTEKNYFNSWLYKIARNTVIDHYRTQKHPQDIDDAWDLASPNNLEEDIDTKNKLEEVKKYIENLKGDQRDILMLRLWQDLSYKEIAAIMDKSEAGCKMAFSRGINELRKQMPAYLFLFLLTNLNL